MKPHPPLKLLPILILYPLAVLILFVTASGCVSRQIAGSSTFTLTILHTNDIHGYYGGITREGLTCYAPLCEGGQGGSVRLAQAVAAIRRDNRNILLLDAGDEYQGTLYSKIYKYNMIADMMNTLAYDAFVPGNHEFDDGCAFFSDLLRLSHIPTIAANMGIAGGLAESLRIEAWIIKNYDGREIGVIGLITTDTKNASSPCREIIFTDEETALRHAVQELTDRGVNIIIALTHVGLQTDRELAQKVDGVDIIVGGHSHSLLSNTDPKAVDRYPVLEYSPSGDPVLVVTASYGLSILGRLNVVFDAEGKVSGWSGDPIVLDEERLALIGADSPDERLAAKMGKYSEAVQAMTQKKIGVIVAAGKHDQPLESEKILECRYGECLTGNIVTDAMLSFFPDADGVLLNAGAIRSSLPAGEVSAGDVLAALPFYNTLALTEMPGKVLLAAIEHGLSHYGEGKGGFLLPAGIKYAFNQNRKAGARLTSAFIRRHKQWQAINPDEKYRVVSVNYLAKGGDGYDLLTTLHWQETKYMLSDVLNSYISGNSPLSVNFENRITLEQ